MKRKLIKQKSIQIEINNVRNKKSEMRRRNRVNIRHIFYSEFFPSN